MLIAAQEAEEKWGTSIFRIRGAGFFDSPSVYCTDLSYVEMLMGPKGLEKSELYDRPKDA